MVGPTQLQEIPPYYRELPASFNEGWVDVTVGEHLVPTHYWEAGSGQPMVLVHGGGPGADGLSNWRECLEIFSERGYRAIAVDMLGYGQNGNPDPSGFTYDTEARIEHMVGFHEALGLEPVVQIGNSMGGSTSLGVAIRRPDRVHRLVLMGSGGLIRLNVDDVMPALSAYVEPSLDNMAAAVKFLTYEHTRVPHFEEHVRYRYLLTENPVNMAGYTASIQWTAQAGGLYFEDEEVASVSAPTLVVQGREDRAVAPEIGLQFHRLINDSWLYLVPHCGHWAMIEATEDFCDAVINFLQRNLPSE
jgi:2-hydroxy-6-oxo-6-(2'-aminophenyl)hexa-2,4-dienoate hydrolase